MYQRKKVEGFSDLESGLILATRDEDDSKTKPFRVNLNDLPNFIILCAAILLIIIIWFLFSVPSITPTQISVPKNIPNSHYLPVFQPVQRLSWSPQRSFKPELFMKYPVVLRRSFVHKWDAVESWKNPSYLLRQLDSNSQFINSINQNNNEQSKGYNDDSTLVGESEMQNEEDDLLDLSKIDSFDEENSKKEDKNKKNYGRWSNNILRVLEGKESYFYSYHSFHPFRHKLWDHVTQKGFEEMNYSPSELFHQIEKSDSYLYFSLDLLRGHRLLSDVKPYTSLSIDSNGPKRVLFELSNGIQTPLHYDSGSFFLVCITGSQRVVLFPPVEHKNLYLYPSISPRKHQSSIQDLYSLAKQLDTESIPYKYNKFNAKAGYEVQITTGDVLYVPAFWSHSIIFDGKPSISVSTWSSSVSQKLSTKLRLIHRSPSILLLQSDRILKATVYVSEFLLSVSMIENRGNKKKTGRTTSGKNVNKKNNNEEEKEQIDIKEVMREIYESRYSHIFDDEKIVSIKSSLREKGEDIICPTESSVIFEMSKKEYIKEIERVVEEFSKIEREKDREILVWDFVEQVVAEFLGVERTIIFLKECF